MYGTACPGEACQSACTLAGGSEPVITSQACCGHMCPLGSPCQPPTPGCWRACPPTAQCLAGWAGWPRRAPGPPCSRTGGRGRSAQAEPGNTAHQLAATLLQLTLGSCINPLVQLTCPPPNQRQSAPRLCSPERGAPASVSEGGRELGSRRLTAWPRTIKPAGAAPPGSQPQVPAMSTQLLPGLPTCRFPAVTGLAATVSLSWPSRRR